MSLLAVVGLKQVRLQSDWWGGGGGGRGVVMLQFVASSLSLENFYLKKKILIAISEVQ